MKLFTWFIFLKNKIDLQWRMWDATMSKDDLEEGDGDFTTPCVDPMEDDSASNRPNPLMLTRIGMIIMILR